MEGANHLPHEEPPRHGHDGAEQTAAPGPAKRPGAAVTAARSTADDQDEEQTRRELLARINSAAVTTLGQVAAITGGNVATDSAGHAEGGTASGEAEPGPADTGHGDDRPEPDPFPWRDAMRWTPWDEAAVKEELTTEDTDRLFGLMPDAEVGTVNDIGWCGMLRHRDRPGGLVLFQNEFGIRKVRQADSDEELGQHWQQIVREHEAFYDATRHQWPEPENGPSGFGNLGSQERQEEDGTGITAAAGTADSQPGRPWHERSAPAPLPEIWVGSLSDYNNGRLYGAWFDATLDAEDLELATAYLLRHSMEEGAEEYGIFDHGGFCGVRLGEYENLDVVSRIARGIAEYGEAFARWVEYVGERNDELLERFQEHYLGEYESIQAYAEHILEETGAYAYLDEIPEGLRCYAMFDVEMMARDLETELYIAELGGGGVAVFDGRG